MVKGHVRPEDLDWYDPNWFFRISLSARYRKHDKGFEVCGKGPDYTRRDLWPSWEKLSFIKNDEYFLGYRSHRSLLTLLTTWEIK